MIGKKCAMCAHYLPCTTNADWMCATVHCIACSANATSSISTIRDAFVYGRVQNARDRHVYCGPPIPARIALVQVKARSRKNFDRSTWFDIL